MRMGASFLGWFRTRFDYSCKSKIIPHLENLLNNAQLERK
jgi:hypothetical protein